MKHITLATLLLATTTLFSQWLDPTFGTAGEVRINPQNTGDDGYAVYIQSDGKILAGGFTTVSGAPEWHLSRLNTDGTLDNAFGTSGTTLVSVNENQQRIRAIEVQTDGKIVAAGTSEDNTGDQDFTVVRYNSDGSVDNTFGTSGMVLTDLLANNKDHFASDLAIQADGKIVVCGTDGVSFNDKKMALVRYNADGSLDNTFGTNGMFVETVISATWGIPKMEMDANEKFVVAASIQAAGKNQSIVARFKSNGALDSSFATDGVYQHSGPGDEYLTFDVAIQSTGRIIVCGTYTSGSTDEAFMYGLTTDGSLDTSFATNGENVFSAGTNNKDFGEHIALLTDNRIRVSGTSGSPSSKNTFYGFDADGGDDHTFNHPVHMKDVPLFSTTAVRDIAVQSDHKIVGVGHYASSPSDLWVLRVGEGSSHVEQPSNRFNLLPNPASAHIMFNTSLEGTLTVLDVSGRVVAINGIVPGDNIVNLAGLVNGPYFVRLTDSRGVSTSSFLKQ